MLAAAAWLLRPFPDVVGTAMTTMADRSPAERINLSRGLALIDGATLQPDVPWSLSARLGARTRHRGFVAGISRLGESRVPTAGGGLCQLASTVHLAALRAGLDPLDRHGHRQPVRSMPPGLDATLWEGGQDLVLVNRGAAPVRLRAEFTGQHLRIRFTGWADGRSHQWALSVRPDGRRLLATGERRTWLTDGTLAPSLRWSDAYSSP